MKCPKCGLQNSPRAIACRRCGEPLVFGAAQEPEAAGAPEAQRAADKRRGVLFWVVCWLIAVPFAGVALYKAWFWVSNWWFMRPYDKGEIAYAQVEPITMDWGKPGHAVTVFGTDGDIIHVDELGESYVVLGGLVRIEVEDSFWFDRDPENIAGADIQLTPTLYREGKPVSQLPIIEFEVDTPYSPVTLVTPNNTTETLYSSVYLLQMTVPPKSTVLINGEDVSDIVDREGLLAANVNVYPQGDNRISLYVSTPHHKDTRMDIVLYRPVMEIMLELSANTEYRSTRTLLTVSGVIDPTAQLVVDSDYEEDSIKVDPETGAFEFRARFSTVGYNTVRFRAVKEGFQDTIIAYQVYYLPSLAEYSRKAWIMDYAQLRAMNEQWRGRVFQCIGTIVDVFNVGDTQYVVMNVGNEFDPKMIVLENMSNTASFDTELQYRAYADVAGDYYYEANNYPLLVARYMDIYVPR